MNIGQKTFQTEQELWHAFLSSDKNAFAYLFEKYADAMYAYGRKMTPDAELVKDAIQDVFVKLYNNRQNLRETVSVKGYLFIALKRTLLNLSQAHSILCLEEMDEVRFEIELISRNAFEEEASCYDEESYGTSHDFHESSGNALCPPTGSHLFILYTRNPVE